MKNTSRRTLLKWALGAGQFALLERAGLLGSSPRHAADTDVPSRLAVLYIPGGYRPAYYFTPLEDAEIPLCVPAPSSYSGEPVFFDASKLVDLAPANGPYKPLRTWQSWNPADPAARGGFSPLMYGFTHFALHEQLSVLHGIDQGTNDHASAFISAMCGVAGADYRAPAVHSVIANHLFERYRESRPLPFVVVTRRARHAARHGAAVPRLARPRSVHRGAQADALREARGQSVVDGAGCAHRGPRAGRARPAHREHAEDDHGGALLAHAGPAADGPLDGEGGQLPRGPAWLAGVGLSRARDGCGVRAGEHQGHRRR